jgi:hypothetical protein
MVIAELRIPTISPRIAQVLADSIQIMSASIRVIRGEMIPGFMAKPAKNPGRKNHVYRLKPQVVANFNAIV